MERITAALFGPMDLAWRWSMSRSSRVLGHVRMFCQTVPSASMWSMLGCTNSIPCCQLVTLRGLYRRRRGEPPRPPPSSEGTRQQARKMPPATARGRGAPTKIEPLSPSVHSHMHAEPALCMVCPCRWCNQVKLSRHRRGAWLGLVACCTQSSGRSNCCPHGMVMLGHTMRADSLLT